MTIGASGDSWTIRSGDQQAEIVQLGGGLRSYSAGGRQLLAEFPAGTRPDAGRGQVLIPWPNRVRDGVFSFGGRHQTLALSEPKKSNASHGLVRWSTWQLEQQRPDLVRVGTRLLAAQGWDWPLDIAITYAVGDDGLQVTVEVTNIGSESAPFGYGHHPYLTVGETNLDEVRLTVPAGAYIEVDSRSLPVATKPVDADTDLRSGRLLDGVQLDTAYTELEPVDGRWQVVLERDGRRTIMWGDSAAFPFVQCFTGDTLPADKRRTSGLAVEPMTCPADAFNSGDHLITLAPGQTWTGRWGVRGE